MIRVDIPELDETAMLANSYNDLKEKDVIKLVHQAFLNPMDAKAKLDLLKQLFVCSDNAWKRLTDQQNHDQLWRLLQTMDWIWKGPEVKPLEFVTVRGKKFLLPDEDLTYLCTAEFVIATAHLMGFWYGKTQQEALKSLAGFLTTIARPKPDVMDRLRKASENGDMREPYNTRRCDTRVPNVEKVDLVTQILLAQWFNNAANKMLKRFGMADGAADDAPINQGVFVQDWERQVVKVAESGVYGNYDAVMFRPVQDVLTYIDLKNEELKRKNKNGSD